MTSTETHPALAHRCPFCRADRGQPCRTRSVNGRSGGVEKDWPHSRRTALTETAEERARYQPVRVDALCCVCGQLRRVNSDYSRRQDPNHSDGDLCNANGWRSTESLKCDQCRGITRHAILNRPDRGAYDYDENLQRMALGGANTSGWSDAYVERLRREYREMPFPRNPNLHHRFYISDATKEWDAGLRTVTALCGAPDTIETDPRTWGTGKAEKNRQKHDGYVVAEQLSDIEYTDADTGLEWIDMDCVDCCRVSNELQTARLRERLSLFLAHFAARPELVPDTAVRDLLQTLEQWHTKKSKGGNS